MLHAWWGNSAVPMSLAGMTSAKAACLRWRAIGIGLVRFSDVWFLICVLQRHLLQRFPVRTVDGDVLRRCVGLVLVPVASHPVSRPVDEDVRSLSEEGAAYRACRDPEMKNLLPRNSTSAVLRLRGDPDWQAEFA